MAQIETRHELDELLGAKVWFVRQVTCVVSGVTVNTSMSTVLAWEIGNKFGRVVDGVFSAAPHGSTVDDARHNLHPRHDQLSDSDPNALDIGEYFYERGDGRQQGVFTTPEEADDMRVYIALCGSGHLNHDMVNDNEAHRQSGWSRVRYHT